jgi:pimeloyl-ACP methyl ester carboxylesterase
MRLGRTLALIGLAAGAAAFVARQRRVHAAVARLRAHDPHAGDVDVFDLDHAGLRVRRVATHDGSELRVYESGPPDALPIVFLHGVTLGARLWGYQLRDLADEFRVIAVDLRGHGGSGVGTEGFGMGPLARDLRTVLETLDLHSATLVGHSMGGMTVMQFCGDWPDVLQERVSGIVLVATLAATVTEARRARAARLATPMLPVAEFAVARRRVGTDTDYAFARRQFGAKPSHTHIEVARSLTADCTAPTMVRSAYGILLHDTEATLARTRIPGLVIAGRADALIPIEASRRLAALLEGSELVELEGTGHYPMLERATEVTRLIRDFARQHAPSSTHATV